MSHTITITPDVDDTFAATTESADGSTTLVVDLRGAADLTDGSLDADAATAEATVAFLLEHQDAADLPDVVDLGDVLAAYADALDRITALRADAAARA